MGILTQFAGIGTTVGVPENIELHVWPACPRFGKGSFSRFDTYTASFPGEVDISLVYTGAVNVSFDLPGRTLSTSSRCMRTLRTLYLTPVGEAPRTAANLGIPSS